MGRWLLLGGRCLAQFNKHKADKAFSRNLDQKDDQWAIVVQKKQADLAFRVSERLQAIDGLLKTQISMTRSRYALVLHFVDVRKVGGRARGALAIGCLGWFGEPWTNCLGDF